MKWILEEESCSDENNDVEEKMSPHKTMRNKTLFCKIFMLLNQLAGMRIKYQTHCEDPTEGDLKVIYLTINIRSAVQV